MAKPRRSIVLLRWSVEWIGSALLWSLFVGSTAWPEVLAGAAAAAASTYGLEVVEFRRLAQLAVRARWFAQAAWVVWYVPIDTWRVLAVLVRHLVGREPAASRLVAVPYADTADDDASATRRALATAYTTMTPNSVVLDVDTSRGLLLVHELRESRTPRMTRALGATA